MKKTVVKRLLSALLCGALLVTMLLCSGMSVSAGIGDTQFYEVEPNDSTGYADRIYSDYTVFGTVGYSDIDFFKIYLSSSTTIQITLVGDNSHLLLGIEDSYDETVAAVQTAYSYSADTYGATLSKYLSSGWYYIGLVCESGYTSGYGFYVSFSGGSSSHTHYYYSYVTYPTCTEGGYTYYECSCGDYYYGNYTDATGHSYSNSYDMYCDDCGAYRTLDGWKYEGGWVYYRNGRRLTNGWARDGQGWRYLGSDGYMVCNGWAQDTYGYCYMGADGLMVKNTWVSDYGDWYFIDANGYMVTNLWKADGQGWCYLGSDGRMVCNGWAADNRGWCYMNASGRITKDSWVKHSGSWYFVNAAGYMVSNTWKKDSNGWCYLQADGRMATNKWVKDSQGWCYVDDSGYCVTNCWKQDSNGWCYLNASGRMATNQWIKDSQGWCFVGGNGYCVTNAWKKDSKGWCYLNSEGRMATDCWVMDSNGWCYIGASGYVTPHKNDNCWHTFSEATYTSPATCSKCGVTNGKAKEISITLNNAEPVYTEYDGRSRMRLSNMYYRVYNNGTLYIYFDVEKTWDEDGNYSTTPVSATFKLFDDDGYLVDDGWYWESNLYVGDKIRGEYIVMDLDNWDGRGELYLDIIDYN